MKIISINFTEQEIDLLLKTLDASSIRGIEMQRRSIALFDKIAGATLAAHNGVVVKNPTDKPPAETPEN